jgi:uncharacterized protein (DUF362 family)
MVTNTTSKVALVEIHDNLGRSLEEGLELIGKVDDLNTKKRSVVVKLGIFDQKTSHHATVDVVEGIVQIFNKAPKILLVESDNYRGTGSERLQKWKALFSKRVVPFNLSEDTDTEKIKIADETIGLSNVLFKPNVFVSTHILRTYEKGSILKNLLGLIPDAKKARFHKKLEPALLDIYKAIGGIDLAVLDGTYTTLGVGPKAKRINTNVLLVGKDAVAVEAVGAAIVGLDPEKMPIVKEAMKRGLGQGNIKKIEVLGMPVESFRQKFDMLLKGAKKVPNRND